MIRIIACRCGEPAKVEEIDSDLRAMQEFVGGYIEIVRLEPGLGLVCNEEGKFFGMPVNRLIFDGRDFVSGDCFLCRVNNKGDCVSVTDQDIEKYKDF